MKFLHTFFRYILLYFITITVTLSANAQATPVFADPAIGSFVITNLADVSVNPDLLALNNIYKIKLDVFNNNPTNAIPPNTAYVDISFGTKFILDPAFTANPTILNNYLSNAPLNTYFTYTYITTGSQPKIRCTISSALPNSFSGQFVFQVKASTNGISNISSNFFVANANPSFILSDDNSGNNSASLQYTNTSVVPVSISDFKATNKKDCTIDVSWAVGQEINVERYEVEYSKDGSNFAKLTSLIAENKNNYSALIRITDQLKAHSLFVRLKSVDKDGMNKYSPIVIVDGTCDNMLMEQLYCYPNPIVKEKTITIASKDGIFSGNYSLLLIDASGKSFMQKQMVLRNISSFKFNINTELAAGKYFIIMQKEDKTINAILQLFKE
jgi:hypothetical protein